MERFVCHLQSFILHARLEEASFIRPASGGVVKRESLRFRTARFNHAMPAVI
jgi:hypothetical protein